MGYEKVYEKLKHEIIWLNIKPETMMALADIADRFGVSRTPVKEALVHLRAEGWIMRHGSHFVTSPLTLGFVRDLTEIRSFMEIQAYIWAMHRITPQGIQRLESILQKLDAVDDNTPNRGIIEIDFKFHQTLFHASENNQLAMYLERILCHFIRLWLSRNREIHPETFFKETREIIKAVKEKDEIRLRAATIAHIKVSLDEIMGL
jgi:DNA-binding GntR family transcriptional regulator